MDSSPWHISSLGTKVVSISSSSLTKIVLTDGHSPNSRGGDFWAGNVLLG